MHSNSNNTVNNNNNEEDNYSSEYNMDTRDSSISEVDLDRPSMIRTLSSSGVRISENAKPTDKCGYLMVCKVYMYIYYIEWYDIYIYYVYKLHTIFIYYLRYDYL